MSSNKNLLLILISVTIISIVVILTNYFINSNENSYNIKEKNEENIYLNNLMSQKKVPILMYHDIDDNSLSDYSISTQLFEQQIKELYDSGYTGVSFDEMIDYVYNEKELPEKPICITFDDGYLSNYELAYPILKKYNMKATIFIIGSSMGTDKYKDTEYKIIPHFSYEKAKEMIDSGLIFIQSHTYDMHQNAKYENTEYARQNFSRFDNETDEEYANYIIKDFKKMKECFKNNLKQDIIVVSYPNGVYNEISEKTLKSLGVKVTLTTDKGSNILAKQIPETLYLMKRYTILRQTSAQELMELIIN